MSPLLFCSTHVVVHKKTVLKIWAKYLSGHTAYFTSRFNGSISSGHLMQCVCVCDRNLFFKSEPKLVWYHVSVRKSDNNFLLLDLKGLKLEFLLVFTEKYKYFIVGISKEVF